MARKVLSRSLPPLHEACPEFCKFAPHQNRFEIICKLLRQVVRSVRRSQVQPFYSVRQVSDFFHVSIHTVSRAFRQLDQEGLLLCQRSSRTVVPARIMRSRIPVRAVIGVPVWLPGFHYFPDWPFLLSQLDGQLRRHNFVADFIFFGSKGLWGADEVNDPAFAEQVLSHHPDIVLWPHLSSPSQKQALQMLRDAGVRTVVLCAQRMFPENPHGFVINYTTAVRKCLADWKRRGVRNVTIPKMFPGKFRNMSATCGELEESLEAMKFQCRTALQDKLPAAQFVKSLADGADVVCFDDNLFCQILCRRAPEEMAALFRRTHTCLSGSVGLPFDHLEGARVDVFYSDYAKMAQHMAEDLNTGAVFLRDTSRVFRTEWSSQVAARQFAQEF